MLVKSNRKYSTKTYQSFGTRRADFVVEGKVLVELKAIIELEDVHLAQGLNYLKAYRLELGFLINFGSKRLKFKRLVLRNGIREIRKSVSIRDSDNL